MMIVTIVGAHPQFVKCAPVFTSFRIILPNLRLTDMHIRFKIKDSM